MPTTLRTLGMLAVVLLLNACQKPSNPVESTGSQTTDATTEQIVQETIPSEHVDSSKDYTPLLQSIVMQQIQPLYQQVNTAAATLADAASQTCHNTPYQPISPEQLSTLRQHYLTVASDWAQTEIINFGPVTDELTSLYINYYPDERGLVPTSVHQLLESEQAITARMLKSDRAVAQGLPAIEYLLYQDDELTERECEYLKASTVVLLNRINEVNTAWHKTTSNSYRHAFVSGSSPFISQKNAVNDWLSSTLMLLESIKNNQLARPLGMDKTGKKLATIGAVPAQASKQSKRIYLAQLRSLQQALSPEYLSQLPLTEDKMQALDVQLKDIQQLIDALPDDVTQASQSQLTDLLNAYKSLITYLKSDIFPAANMQVGFNNSDGD